MDSDGILKINDIDMPFMDSTVSSMFVGLPIINEKYIPITDPENYVNIKNYVNSNTVIYDAPYYSNAAEKSYNGSTFRKELFVPSSVNPDDHQYAETDPFHDKDNEYENDHPARTVYDSIIIGSYAIFNEGDGNEPSEWMSRTSNELVFATRGYHSQLLNNSLLSNYKYTYITYSDDNNECVSMVFPHSNDTYDNLINHDFLFKGVKITIYNINPKYTKHIKSKYYTEEFNKAIKDALNKTQSISIDEGLSVSNDPENANAVIGGFIGCVTLLFKYKYFLCIITILLLLFLLYVVENKTRGGGRLMCNQSDYDSLKTHTSLIF